MVCTVDFGLTVRRVRVTLPLHYRDITVTSPLHYHYITVTSPLHYRYVTVTLPLQVELSLFGFRISYAVTSNKLEEAT